MSLRLRLSAGLLLRVSATLAALMALIMHSYVAHAEASRLACGVCEAIVDEVEAGILATAQQHSVQTRWRIDEKKSVSYARTEHNLLEIIEAPGFTRKFDQYGVVKPKSPSATLLKQAFAEANGAKGDNNNSEKQETEENTAANTEVPVDAPAAPEVPASATETTEGAAAAASTPADTLAAAASAAAGASPLPKGTGGSFKASGPLPLSLEWDLPHMILMSHIKGSNLSADKSPETRAEIAVEVNSFLEEHLETALVMFHKDEPDIKRRLCGEVTRACQQKHTKQKNKRKAKAKPAPKEEL